MTEFKVGDRVAFYASVGTVTVVGTPRIEVQADDGTQHWFGAISQAHLRRIGEPWQGECAYYRCTQPLRAGDAHIYHEGGDDETHGCAWYCENHFDVLTLGMVPPTREEQPIALALSRQWMRERYPDEAKWTEATT